MVCICGADDARAPMVTWGYFRRNHEASTKKIIRKRLVRIQHCFNVNLEVWLTPTIRFSNHNNWAVFCRRVLLDICDQLCIICQSLFRTQISQGTSILECLIFRSKWKWFSIIAMLKQVGDCVTRQPAKTAMLQKHPKLIYTNHLFNKNFPNED